MARIEQIIGGIAAYIENEFIKNLPAKSPAKVIIGTAVTLYLFNKQGKIKEFFEGETASALGISSQNGDYDIEHIKDIAVKYIEDDGMDIEFSTYLPNIKTAPIIGNMINEGIIPAKITLYKEDVDKIAQYMNS